MDYVAMQSCTSGRNAFFTGMYPLRTGMIPPQLPGSPSYLRPWIRLAVCKRIFDICVNEYGLPADSIIFDVLTFPVTMLRKTLFSTARACGVRPNDTLLTPRMDSDPGQAAFAWRMPSSV